MSWRQLADERLHTNATEDIRDSRDKIPSVGPNVPNVPIVPPADHGTIPTEQQARTILRDWHAKLVALDTDAGPAEYEPQRWRQLVEDAHWLYERHASQLVREGWSALDVFGVLPWREQGGCFVDRLHGLRNLTIDGKGRAFWTWSYAPEVTFQTCRGASDALVSSGLVLVWEVA